MLPEIKKIAVIGDGGWGTTLAIYLARKKFPVSFSRQRGICNGWIFPLVLACGIARRTLSVPAACQILL